MGHNWDDVKTEQKVHEYTDQNHVQKSSQAEFFSHGKGQKNDQKTSDDGYIPNGHAYGFTHSGMKNLPWGIADICFHRENNPQGI